MSNRSRPSVCRIYVPDNPDTAEFTDPSRESSARASDRAVFNRHPKPPSDSLRSILCYKFFCIARLLVTWQCFVSNPLVAIRRALSRFLTFLVGVGLMEIVIRMTFLLPNNDNDFVPLAGFPRSQIIRALHKSRVAIFYVRSMFAPITEHWNSFFLSVVSICLPYDFGCVRGQNDSWTSPLQVSSLDQSRDLPARSY